MRKYKTDVVKWMTARNVHLRLRRTAPVLLSACKLALEHLNKTDATHDSSGRPIDTTGIRRALQEAINQAAS